jgi:superfamily II DNA or RNA helicase
MNNKINLVKEFASHISYGLDRYKERFKPNLKEITLTEYQQFTASLFLLEDFNRLLLFWETGFGKTIFCTYIIQNVFKIYPQWKIFIFVKSSLRNDPWLKTIDKFLPENIKYYIEFIHYDHPNILNFLLLKLKTVSPQERIFFIFDESHDFIKKLIPKDTGALERRLTPLMDPIITNINKGLNKVLFMSATPIVDNYKEFLYMCNFLRTGKIALSQKIFNKEDILIEPVLLKHVCLGLCSYQRRSEPDVFKDVDISENTAGKKIFFHDIFMSNEQSSIYKTVSLIELKSKARGFRTLRKLVNTFAFQEIKIKGNIDEEEYEKLIKERFSVFENIMSKVHFSDSFIDKVKYSSLKLKEETALAKNLNCFSSEPLSFNSSLNISKKKDDKELASLRLLNSFSSKYIKTCQLILQARGKCLVYQPFVSFEGVKTFCLYLEKFNISFIEYTQKTRVNRSDLVKQFNRIENKNGEEIKCCVLSGAGSEGISMTNITDMIIMDIPWSGSQLEQIFGRGIRLNSHLDLPLEERYVNIHIPINRTSTSPSYSIDEELLELLKSKERKKLELVKVLEESSIESIYNRYPDIQSVETTNFYPLINITYNVEQMRKTHVSVLKQLIKIYITFDLEFKNIREAMLEEETNLVFENGENTGTLVLDENNKKIFKVIKTNLVYLVKPL